MKPKQLLSTILFLFAITCNYAQASFTSAGIAVQGIARDNNNTAITTGESIDMTFTIYYDDAGSEKTAYTVTEPLTPDAFGVFSYLLDIDPEKNQDFANFQMRLRIETKIGADDIIISDEQLKYVPYAISANNGVPMGSVMPYLGDSAPMGWILCQGQTFASVGAKGNSLKAFLGDPTNVPDLQGMFLRGAGTNSMTATETQLNGTQDDGFEKHKHENNFSISGGIHQHSWTEAVTSVEDGSDKSVTFANGGSRIVKTRGDDGEHTHSLGGEISDSGNIEETRPVNYGVNYIIKL